jgi:hypothetical protein
VEKNGGEEELTRVPLFCKQRFFLDQLWKETVKVDSIPPRVPHYLIIDAQGRIVDDNAPGPGDKRIYAKLTAILNHKIYNEEMVPEQIRK